MTAARRKLIGTNSCEDLVKYPHKDVFGFDFIWNTVQAVRSKHYLEINQHLHRVHGSTFYTTLLGSVTVHTIEPENIKSITSTNFKNYGIDIGRKDALRPRLGQSILISDGAQWEHSRAFLRPCFAKSQVGNLAVFDIHVTNLLKAIQRDVSKVDLGDLFFCYTAEVATEFMYGESIGSLTCSLSFPPDFVNAFHDAAVGCEERYRWGKLAKFTLHSKFHRSVERVHAFIQKHVQKSLAYHSSCGTELNSIEASESTKRYVLLRELGKTTNDVELLRGELLTIFFAERNTTASLLSNMFFMLAKQTDG